MTATAAPTSEAATVPSARRRPHGAAVCGDVEGPGGQADQHEADESAPARRPAPPAGSAPTPARPRWRRPGRPAAASASPSRRRGAAGGAIRCGASVSARKGSARPSPSARMTASATAAGWVSAKPTAVAMKGAVHGVATTAASTPVENEPASPGCRVRPCADALQRAAQVEHAGQAQAHGEQHVGQHGDGQRRLQLEAPADLGAGGAQAEQHGAERRERRQHAGGIGEAVAAHLVRDCRRTVRPGSAP